MGIYIKYRAPPGNEIAFVLKNVIPGIGSFLGSVTTAATNWNVTCDFPGGIDFIIAYCPASDLKSGLLGKTELPASLS